VATTLKSVITNDDAVTQIGSLVLKDEVVSVSKSVTSTNINAVPTVVVLIKFV